MWRIEEHRRVDKQLSSASREILKRYEKWKDKDKDIAMLSAPWSAAHQRLQRRGPVGGVEGPSVVSARAAVARHLSLGAGSAAISGDSDHRT
ncbi:MAG: hypothetical protein QJR02_06125 [Sinobacteraceae bacterium]|nr:hypothetical protein [Nevskiaceae bacterium]